MPRFCIDRRVLGTEGHLDCDGTSVAWADVVPSGVWHLSGQRKDDSDWCLDTALRLAGKAVVTRPPDRFVRSMTLLSSSMGDVPVPWHRVMPRTEHRAFAERLVADVGGAMAGTSFNHYETVWRAGNGIFRALQRAAVDGNRWRELVLAKGGNVDVVETFKPEADGLARPVTYDRFATLTGRLTVRSGPRILTLKRSSRDLLASRHGKEGGVYALDFAALEARVLLYEHGRSCDVLDLYGTIARELGRDRKAIKGAVISELYGSSKAALGAALDMHGAELDEFVRRVRAYFDTDLLLRRIKRQFVATGSLINRHGRAVVVDDPLDRILINYYAQSTGVDVTMLGFRQVVDALAVAAPRTAPVFLLHDALLLDVHDDDLHAVKQVDGVTVPGYVQRFPLKLERVA